jgi:hypothetical protein
MTSGFGKSKKNKKGFTLAEAKRLSLDEQKKVSHVTQLRKGDLIIQSRMNSRDQRPMVDVEWGKKRMQLTPAEAFKLALDIIETAIAAETDSTLFDFLSRLLGADNEIAVFVILEFRKFREENPKRFTAWRGRALNILTAAESAESDEFLRTFLERIRDSEGNTTLDLDEVISMFQEFRASRQSQLKTQD